MATVDDKFESHRIRTLIESLRSSIEQGVEAAHTAEGSETLAVLDQVVETFSRALGSVDPALMPMNLLDDAAANVEAMVPRVDAFVSNLDAAQLEANIRPHLDALLRATGTISALAGASSLPEGLQTAVTTYRRSAGQHIAGLAAEATQLRTDYGMIQNLLTSMEEQIRSHEGRLDSAISEFNNSSRTRWRHGELSTAPPRKRELRSS
jgi:hypothetical protein